MAMTPQEAARIIWDSARKGVYYPEPLKGQLTIDQGYETQLKLLAMNLRDGEEQAGWKIGITSNAVREFMKSDTPAFGYLLGSRHFSSGLSFSYGEMIAPAIEAELCFTLGQPLKGPNVTPEQVVKAIASVAPAFEIVELRGDIGEDLPLGVADNVSQWAWLTGNETRPYPRDLKLGDVVAEIFRNSKLEVEARGEDSIDNQFDSIAWLANRLSDFGESLRAGMRIMSGSFIKPILINRGDRWEAKFSGLGNVTVRFE